MQEHIKDGNKSPLYPQASGLRYAHAKHKGLRSSQNRGDKKLEKLSRWAPLTVSGANSTKKHLHKKMVVLETHTYTSTNALRASGGAIPPDAAVEMLRQTYRNAVMGHSGSPRVLDSRWNAGDRTMRKVK